METLNIFDSIDRFGHNNPWLVIILGTIFVIGMYLQGRYSPSRISKTIKNMAEKAKTNTETAEQAEKVTQEPANVGVSVGDVIELKFFQGTKGAIPIARHESGLLCLMTRDIKGFYEYGSTWSCEVVRIDPNKLIILPLRQIRSATENLKLEKNTPKGAKHQPVKSKQYPYMTAVEKRKTE